MAAVRRGTGRSDRARRASSAGVSFRPPGSPRGRPLGCCPRGGGRRPSWRLVNTYSISLLRGQPATPRCSVRPASTWPTASRYLVAGLLSRRGGAHGSRARPRSGAFRRVPSTRAAPRASGTTCSGGGRRRSPARRLRSPRATPAIESSGAESPPFRAADRRGAGGAGPSGSARRGRPRLGRPRHPAAGRRGGRLARAGPPAGDRGRRRVRLPGRARKAEAPRVDAAARPGVAVPACSASPGGCGSGTRSACRVRRVAAGELSRRPVVTAAGDPDAPSPTRPSG